MKKIYLLFGIMMALMLCITPVAAVSGDDFEIVIDKDNKPFTYTYSNVNNPDEKYFQITTGNTDWMYSIVTFKPANIPDTTVMVVDTNTEKKVCLPRCIDDWEIKYYSSFTVWLSKPEPEYLKNAGTINLNEKFGEYIRYGLLLKLDVGQWIHAVQRPSCYWIIPEA